MSDIQDNVFWVGIDVAKQTFQAAVAHDGVRPDQWTQLPTRPFPFNAAGLAALVQWIGEQPGCCRGLCAESTGIYSKRLAAMLAATPLPPLAVVNPARPLALARSMGVRDKTDRLDAAVIALYGLIHRPRALRRGSPHHERLRQLWRLREDYVREMGAFENRIEQADDPFVRRQLRATCRQMAATIERTEQQIEQTLAEDSTLERDACLLQSIPGIGRRTAWMLLAELGDLRTWTRRQLVGYAGLFPRRYESGTSVHRRARLARGGGARVRTGLFMAALSIRRRSNPLSGFAARLVQQGKAKMCAIGALMRKLLLVARAVIISGQPFDPNRIGTSNYA